MHVTDGTEESAAQRVQNASISTSAKRAEDLIELTNVKGLRREELEPRAKHPHYTQGLLWDDEDDTLSATAQYSLFAAPLPRVPVNESSNKSLMNTI
jgi:hypothetical protein